MKPKAKSLKYCCVCKGIHRGKVVDGRTVSLHRFPQNKRIKRVWIQRCRTVMKSFQWTFQWTENRLLCSEHFVDFKGPSMLNTLPSRFPTSSGTDKIFPTSTLDENEQVPDTHQDESDVQDKPFIATRIELTTPEDPSTEFDDQQNGDETPFIQDSQQSNLDVSLNFHEYTSEPIHAPSTIRYIEQDGDNLKVDMTLGKLYQTKIFVNL